MVRHSWAPELWPQSRSCGGRVLWQVARGYGARAAKALLATFFACRRPGDPAHAQGPSHVPQPGAHEPTSRTVLVATWGALFAGWSVPADGRREEATKGATSVRTGLASTRSSGGRLVAPSPPRQLLQLATVAGAPRKCWHSDRTTARGRKPPPGSCFLPVVWVQSQGCLVRWWAAEGQATPYPPPNPRLLSPFCGWLRCRSLAWYSLSERSKHLAERLPRASGAARALVTAYCKGPGADKQQGRPAWVQRGGTGAQKAGQVRWAGCPKETVGV